MRLTKESRLVIQNMFRNDGIIAPNRGSLFLSESLVYSYCSLGLKNNATPCGVFMQLHRLNQSVKEVKRALLQAMHHGTGDSGLEDLGRGALYDPL